MLRFLGSTKVSLAIDLGTRNILISNSQKVLFRQQTVAAFPSGDGGDQKRKIIVGTRAEEIFEKRPSQYEIVRPLRRGVICDLSHCKKILESALKEVTKHFIRKPGILISCPLDVTPIEKAAFKDVLSNIGFSKVELVPEPTAAAAGMLSNFHKKKGLLVLDVGAGITEAVVFSLGGIVCNTSARIGGEDLEYAIAYYIKTHFDFEIGNQAALLLLSILGDDHPDSYLQAMELKGLSTQSRLPGTLKIEMMDIRQALDEHFRVIVQTVRRALEIIPEELSSDIIENGIYLTGGASQYRRLVEMLQKETGLTVNVDTQPLLGVARGEIALLQDTKLRAFCVNS